VVELKCEPVGWLFPYLRGLFDFEVLSGWKFAVMDVFHAGSEPPTMFTGRVGLVSCQTPGK
jgi:hypothetical protein